VVASDVYFWAASRKRRYQLPEKDLISPDEVLSALKRYLEKSGDTEQAVASKIGVNYGSKLWLLSRSAAKVVDGR